jgi:hypothetical protein
MRVFSNGPTGAPSARVPGLGAAIVPVPAQLGEAYQSWGEVVGCPGTAVIPAPNPAAVPQDYSHTALHKSSDGPQSWRPGIYYQPKLASTPPVSVYSDNQMPVPALTPAGKPAIQMRRPLFLGQRQVGQPAVTPSFAWWK